MEQRLKKLEARRRPPRGAVVLLIEREGRRYRQTGELVTDSDMEVLRQTCDTVITLVGVTSAQDRT